MKIHWPRSGVLMWWVLLLKLQIGRVRAEVVTGMADAGLMSAMTALGRCQLGAKRGQSKAPRRAGGAGTGLL